MRWLVVLVSLAACGSVSDNKPDAAAAKSDGAVDAVVEPPVDAAPAVPTAIHVTNTAIFSAPSGTFTKVAYATEGYDDANEFDATTSRFTPKQAGDYLVCASIFAPSTTFELTLYKNNAREGALDHGSSVTRGCRVVRLVLGDSVEVWLHQGSGAPVTIDPNVYWNWLTIHKLTSLAELGTAAGSFMAANQTFTVVPYAQEVYDTGNAFDTTNHRFTAAQAGDYLVCSSMALNDVARRAELDTYVNGNRESGIAYSTAAPSGCRYLRLAANDYLDVRLHHQLGSTVTFNHDPYWNWITVSRVVGRVAVKGITAFTLPGASFTKVPYTSETLDTNGEFDTSTSTFTASAAGDYLICTSFDPQTLTPEYELDLYKNGTRLTAIVHGWGASTGCMTLRLAASDQITVHAYASAQVSVTDDGLWFWFQVAKLN